MNENKQLLQLLLGNALNENAPLDKAIVLSGAYKDPTEVRSNKLSPRELEELTCDHKDANTRIVLHVVKANKAWYIMWCNDTDILIATLANYSKINHKKVYMRRAKKQQH